MQTNRSNAVAPVALSLLCIAAITACGDDGGGGNAADAGGDGPFVVSASAGAGGSITPASLSVEAGQSASFTVTADANFTIEEVAGCGGSLDGATYTTAAIVADCAVTVSFIMDLAPTNLIHFPTASAATDAPTLHFVGLAGDSDGTVDTVVVTDANSNQLATTTPEASGWWTATVPLSPGLHEYTVTVTDNDGLISTLTQSVHRRVYVIDPRASVLDSANNRLLLIDNGLDAVLSVDLQTGNRMVISDSVTGTGPDFDFPFSLALDSSNGRLFVVDNGLDAVIAVDLQTGNRSVISDGDVGSGPIFTNPRSVALDSAGSRLLVTDLGRAAVMSVDIATGDTALFSDASNGTGTSLSGPGDIVFSEASGLLYLLDGTQIIEVDGSNGDRSVLSNNASAGPNFGFPRGLALDTPNKRLLVIDASLRAVDLTTGTRSTLSDNSDDLLGPPLQNALHVVFDGANGRAFVVDNVVLGVVEIGLQTGMRSLHSDNGTGGGADFLSPTFLSLDESANEVFVMDDGRSALLRVDTQSGNRTLISDQSLGTGSNFSGPAALVADSANNRVLVLDGGRDEVTAVDLQSGNRTTVAGGAVGTGPTFPAPQGFALDGAANRVLILDSLADALLAADLQTGNRSVISSASVGTGPVFGLAQDIALDTANMRAFVVDSDLDAVFSIDLSSGNRSIVSDASTGGGPLLLQPLALVFDASQNRLLLSDSSLDAIVAVDLATGLRSLISQSGPVEMGTGPAISRGTSLDLDPVKGILFVTDTGLDSLLVVDLASGDRVISSR